MDNGVDAMPRMVRNLARDVHKIVGEEPTVKQLSPLSWRVALVGSRVDASADFRSVNGKTKQVGGALVINGKRRPNVGLTELRHIWDKYERHASRLEPVPPLPVGMPVPSEVRQFSSRIVVNDGEDVPTAIGYANGRWVVGIDGVDGDGLRVYASRKGRGPWWVSDIRVISHGKDRSAEVGGDLAKAAAIFAGSNPAPDDPPAPQGKPAPAMRDNGIAVRKGNVIRV